MSETLAMPNVQIDRRRETGAVFAHLVQEHQTPLLRYVQRLLGPGDDAESVVQDAFVKLHRQMHDNGRATVDNAAGWLYRVAHNRAMDLRRKRRRRRDHRPALAAHKTRLDAGQAHAVDPADHAAHRDAVAHALDALDGLDDEQQRIVRLKIMHGLTLREISQAMDMPLANVHYRLTRALGKLSAELKRRGAL